MLSYLFYCVYVYLISPTHLNCEFKIFFWLYCVHIHTINVCRRSCSLVDILLALSEKGHYDEVMSIFASPFKKCPELIFLSAIRAKVCTLYVCAIHLVIVGWFTIYA